MRGKGRAKRTHASDCTAVEDTESILRIAWGVRVVSSRRRGRRGGKGREEGGRE